MCSPATICVDDNFATSQTSITLRTANDELARRIDVQVSVITEKGERWLSILECDFFQCFLDDLFDNQLIHLLHGGSSGVWARVASDLFASRCFGRLGMLSRDDNSVDLAWFNRSISFL